MDLDAEEVIFWALSGDLGGGLSHPKADLDNARREAGKRGIEIQRLILPRQQEVRPEFGQRFFLATADAPGAQYETSDAALGVCGVFGRQQGQEPIMPLVGELGLAW